MSNVSTGVQSTGPESLPEETFSVRGTTVKVRLNRLGLELIAVKAILAGFIGRDVLGLCELLPLNRISICLKAQLQPDVRMAKAVSLHA